MSHVWGAIMQACEAGPSQVAPLISVVVPTYNSACTLPATLASLAEQEERAFEVIISDGASSDGTGDLARSTATGLPSLTVLSRPDHGVYDGINRAIEVATGDWVLVLGADDRLHSQRTLRQVAPHLRARDALVVYGDVRMMSANRLGVPVGGRYAGPMPLPRLLRGNICQQSIFYRRELFARLGPFDLGYPVLADWEFNLRAAFRVKFQWIDVVVADYAADGMSARRVDGAAIVGIPKMVTREFLARADDRSLWPLQRILLRQADVLRRQGHWRAALGQLGSYLQLRAQRLRLLNREGPVRGKLPPR